MKQLSSYRIMWLFVMFDLPVTTKSERKIATKFRNDLLDLGFEMNQFSVYLRFFSSNKQMYVCIEKIKRLIPDVGKVSLLQFTDKQFEKTITFYGIKQIKNKIPSQYELF